MAVKTENNLCLTRCEFAALFAVLALVTFAAFYSAGVSATEWVIAVNRMDLD